MVVQVSRCQAYTLITVDLGRFSTAALELSVYSLGLQSRRDRGCQYCKILRCLDFDFATLSLRELKTQAYGTAGLDLGV